MVVMKRRGFLVAAGVPLLAGCVAGIGDDEPRFMGPTEEDPDTVDVRYRAFTEDEIDTIRSEARTIPYDDLLANVDAHVGSPIVFDGLLVTIREEADHFVYQISMAGNPQELQWAFASWTGAAFEEAAFVTCWGEVLGPEVFTRGMGEELTVPAIAIADMELNEE